MLAILAKRWSSEQQRRTAGLPSIARRTAQRPPASTDGFGKSRQLRLASSSGGRQRAVPHLGRPEQAMAEFRRVLVPDGRLALTAWDLPARARLVGVLLDAVREVGVAPPQSVPAGPDFFRFADDAEFAALLKAFTDVEVRTVAFLHSSNGADELWDGLLHGTVRTSAVIRGQPDGVVQRIRAGFDRRLQGYWTGETYQLPVSFKLARGRRS
jgi:SAM-dependent methyltransferase